MELNWTSETAEMLKKINEETDKLIKEDLPIEEFHKKHNKLMQFWDEEEKRLKNKYPSPNKLKAIPKNRHITTHMADRFLLRKMLNKFKT